MTSYESDALFLQAVILRHVDALSDGVLARVAVLRARYRAARDGGMLDLVWRAQERIDEGNDRTFLIDMIIGKEDLLTDSIWKTIEPMFNRYPEGTQMYALLEEASIAFGTAVDRAVAWTLAGLAIDEARRAKER